MLSQHLLGIVIPAYKLRFLDRALESLANQTDQNFRVYIGNDASPEDLEGACDRWRDKLDLHYKNFTENLGKRDLVAQWNRCIALAREEWIWLFSDDDEAEANCVSAWRSTLERNPSSKLFHFDVVQIDSESRVTREAAVFPETLTARRFLLARFRSELSSYAPDYIFNRSALERSGGFQSFPLAWCSDDAAWATLSDLTPIQAIRGAKVRWRLSDLNISSVHPELGASKVAACLEYLSWLDKFLKTTKRWPGDPEDEAIISASQWWFFAQARSAQFFFGPIETWNTARHLARLKGHNFFGSLARALLSNQRLSMQLRRKSDQNTSENI